MADGSTTAINSELIDRLFSEELDAIKEELGSDAYIAGRFPEAAKVFEKASTSLNLTAATLMVFRAVLILMMLRRLNCKTHIPRTSKLRATWQH